MAVLTDAKARAIKPEGKDLPDGTVMGLWLKPTAKKGRGQWNFRYVSPITKKRRDMGLGAYPDVSIVEARRQANAARGEIRRKQDPIDQRKAAGEVAGSAMTFEQAALRMYDQIRTGWKNPKHAQQWINSLRAYVFTMIGSVTVEALQPDDFRKVLAPIWLKKSETAMRVKQRCHAVMDWCLAQNSDQRQSDNRCQQVASHDGEEERSNRASTLNAVAGLSWANPPALLYFFSPRPLFPP